MRTCPLGPAPESSLSRRPASRPVLVCPGPHRCVRDPVSAYFSFSLRVSVSLRPSKPLYLCLPVSRPPTFNPLHPPKQSRGLSAVCDSPRGLPVLSRWVSVFFSPALCALCRVSVFLLLGLCVLSLGLSVLFPAFCSLFPGLSVLPPPSLDLASRVSCRVSGRSLAVSVSHGLESLPPLCRDPDLLLVPLECCPSGSSTPRWGRG